MTTAPATAPPIAPRPKHRSQTVFLIAYQPRHPSFIADSYVFVETMSRYHRRRQGHQWRGFSRYGNCVEMLPFLQAMQELVEHQR